jgi:penicillin-binding protein 1A
MKTCPPNLVHAAVATEDVRFYKHSGVDFWSLGRVFRQDFIVEPFQSGRWQYHFPAIGQNPIILGRKWVGRYL